VKRTVLAVDIGTSSLKAALIDSQGTIVAATRVRFPKRPATVPGIAGAKASDAPSAPLGAGLNRGAMDWLAAFRTAVGELTSARAADTHTIDAICISGNGPTLVSVDHADQAGSLLLWNDPIPDSAATKARTIAPSLFLPRLLAYRQLFPGDWDAARVILSGPEYLAYALTGVAVTSLPDARYEAAYWSPTVLSAAGLDAGKLAPLVPFGPAIGVTSYGRFAAGYQVAAGNEVAAGYKVATGTDATVENLPGGIPVFSGGPDFIAALIGTNTLKPGAGCDRAGTSEGLNVCVSHPTAAANVRPLPAPVARLWNASYLLPETGARFSAWRNSSALRGRSYPDIMAEIAKSPLTGADDGEIREGRRLVEEIGFAVRRGIETLRAATGCDPVWRLSGGQARNAIWNRMKADITGSTFELTSTPDGELMGDAIAAFVGLGEYGSLTEAADAMVSVVETYECDQWMHSYYSERYQRHENL
jgi:xylulokinase